MAEACKTQSFDLLIIGHKLEYPFRNEMCSTFRKFNKGGLVVQFDLQASSLMGESDYVHDVSSGPASLLDLLTKILDKGANGTSKVR